MQTPDLHRPVTPWHKVRDVERDTRPRLRLRLVEYLKIEQRELRRKPVRRVVPEAVHDQLAGRDVAARGGDGRAVRLPAGEQVRDSKTPGLPDGFGDE